MGFLEDIFQTRDIPELKDQDFPDHEQRLYHYFLEKMHQDGLNLPILFNKGFKEILHLRKNPHLIEAVRKALEKYEQENKSKNAPKFEEVVIQGEEFIEKIPLFFFIPRSSLMNVISKRAQSRMSIRHLIYTIFPLYKDDLVEYTLSYRGKEIASGSGEIFKCTIPTAALEAIPSSSKDLELMSLNLKLTGCGDNRRRHEDSSNIFDTEAEKKSLVNQEVQFDLFTQSKHPLTAEQFVERAKLFQVDIPDSSESSEDYLRKNLVPSDFGAKQLTDIRSVHSRFSQFESNSELLKFRDRLNLELHKMKEWLDRENPDGMG